MKRPFLSVFLCGILVFSLGVDRVGAQGVRGAERTLLLEHIAELHAQIALLESRLSELQKIAPQRGVVRSAQMEQIETRRSSLELHDLTPSTYYIGRYVGVYEVDGTELLAINSGSIPQEDRDIWELFVDIAGEDSIKRHIGEFRVYDNSGAEHDGFIEQIADDGKWVLGINLSDVDLFREPSRGTLRDLLIHEYGHILVHENEYVLPIFEELFWSDADHRHAERLKDTGGAARRYDLAEAYYESNDERFVSAYATTNPLEDIVESFVHFVNAGRQASHTKRIEKMNFFYDYPEFTTVRDRLR